VFATAGIHPCSSSIFTVAHKRSHEEDVDDDPVDATAGGPDAGAPQRNVEEVDPAKSGKIISDLRKVIDDARSSGKTSALAAFGEFGLDYDRLHFCGKTAQLHSFREQLALAASLSPQLPLFLHSRAAHEDFVALLKEAFGPKLARLEKGGVVHSFTGSVEEMRELMELGLYIGVNGCSFKTAENCAVVKEIRLDRLMIETDGPWCEIRPSHEGYRYLLPPKSETASGHASEESAAGKASKKKGGKGQQEVPKVPDAFKTVKKEKWELGAMVKGRNEPCMIERVAEIIAKIKGETLETVCEAAWANTVKVFGIADKDA
jgi:TatD DNase family protein